MTLSLQDNMKKQRIIRCLSQYGVHGVIRTRDHSLRRRVLYPAELRGRIPNDSFIIIQKHLKYKYYLKRNAKNELNNSNDLCDV